MRTGSNTRPGNSPYRAPLRRVPLLQPISPARAETHVARGAALARGVKRLGLLLRPRRAAAAPPETADSRGPDALLVGVAQNLRGSLQRIRSCAEALRADPSLSEQGRRRLLETVISEDQRLSELVDRILDASHFERGTGRWTVEVGKIDASMR